MYIITGGAGFIGSVLVRFLNSLDIENILIVDNLGKSDKWKNLVKCTYIDYINKDDFLKQIVTTKFSWKIKAIIHLGACSSTTETNAEYLMSNNYYYSKILCEYAMSNAIRFITASSAATYGNGSYGFSDNIKLIPQLRPLNMYAYTKHLTDLWAIKKLYNPRIASLKFFNVYGPNEYHKGDMRSVVLKAFEQIQRTGRLQLFKSNSPDITDGEQKRDFVYVKDCAALIYWFITHPDVNGIFNVGTGHARSFNELGNAVFKTMNYEQRIGYIDIPRHLKNKYQNYTCADMSWLKEKNCDVELRSLEQGVADYIQNYLINQEYYV